MPEQAKPRPGDEKQKLFIRQLDARLAQDAKDRREEEAAERHWSLMRVRWRELNDA